MIVLIDGHAHDVRCRLQQDSQTLLQSLARSLARSLLVSVRYQAANPEAEARVFPAPEFQSSFSQEPLEICFPIPDQ